MKFQNIKDAEMILKANNREEKKCPPYQNVI